MRNSIYQLAVLFLALYATDAHSGSVSYHSKAAHEKAVKFSPGIISTEDNFEINTVFNRTGDTVIFARCEKDFSKCTLMQAEYQNGQWGKGTVLPFSGNYLDADPYYNEDYSQLYFISKRPIEKGNATTKNINLWRVALSEGEWGAPEYLADLSSDADDLYPSLTAKGDLFFPSFRNDKRMLYVAKKTNNGFATPEPIPAYVYGDDAKIGDSAVSRDGKSIVFSISNRADSLGKGDLYISHWADGKWSVAKSLGDVVNTSDHEFTPIMSPDGEYLFFTRIENGLGNLYQVHKSLLNREKS